ncbi:hypothetical protein C1H46_002571 [Malus baccata]|uniref:Uncharacterized protein n=1 Tax=Malus baccata TaxID=106549 RepID=A0A540NL17_MALBA|nr:hypothetical protein C1H46_002571 [Malus baccata]
MSSESEEGGHMIKLFRKTIPLAMAPLNHESSSSIDVRCGAVDSDLTATACDGGGDGGGGAENYSETSQKLSSSSAATNSDDTTTFDSPATFNGNLPLHSSHNPKHSIMAERLAEKGRGRRPGRCEKEEMWVPVKKLGRFVKEGKIRSLEQIYLHSLPIKEI